MAVLVISFGSVEAFADDSDRAKGEFFESRIRPILVENCYECHAAGAKAIKGGLRLDSKAGVLTGGDSGPAVVPGMPDESPLYLAIRYEGEAENMPPKAKLPQRMIEDVRKWIADGAYDPRTASEPVAKAGNAWAKTFRERLDWWAFRPVNRMVPPEVGFAATPIDAFLAVKLREAGLEFAPQADRPTLLRRLHFDLTGLPPTPADLAAFLADTSPDAYEKVVDRLLASPHYGERMARRWMDLMRYSETVGSEQDALIPYAWAYRDYLIRAFNADLPYDRLVREHLAGDRVSPPRRDPATGLAESPIGTAWMRFVEYYHSPVDVKNEEITVIDNQVDTLGKAFLGLTIACARCHDHKFDPIGTDDFYRYYGALRTARATVHTLKDPASVEPLVAPLRNQRERLRAEIAKTWSEDSKQLKEKLIGEFQASGAVDPQRDAFWKRADDPRFWANPWARARAAIRSGTDAKSAWEQAWKAAEGQGAASWELPGSKQKLIADFTQPDKIPPWSISAMFTPRYSEAGTFRVGPKPESIVEAIRPSGFWSDTISEKLGVTLRSPEFELTDGTYSALVSGTSGARLRLVIENFQGVDILFAGVAPVLNEARPTWVRLPVREIWKGRRAYLELVTRDEMPSTGVIRDLNQLPRDGRSSVGIRYVVHHANGEAAFEPSAAAKLSEKQSAFALQDDVAKALAASMAGVITEAVEAFRASKLNDTQATLLTSLLDTGLLRNSAAAVPELAKSVANFRQAEEAIDLSARTVGVAEDASSDLVQNVFLRGDYRRQGARTPAGDLAVLVGSSGVFAATKSPRESFADSITRPDHPLMARVMVNRLWSWCFGKGLFTTEDNVGRLGEPPSHPELLDYLATEFVREGYSMKRTLRAMVLSRAYRQSSVANEKAATVDPTNRLLSHAPVRRLDAESLRDAILTASGRLDRTLYGLPVPTPQPPGLTDDKKPVSGPVDGAGRRSVYLNVRKNFPVEFLEVFDRPRPTLPVGRRNVSNQPSQALALMNDPFVLGESERLGKYLQNLSDTDDSGRVRELYRRALARDPRPAEVDRTLDFMRRGASWAELAHALFGMKEFLFVP
ncbi:DUF1553 domain-containing protein [bacterium]|nr:DUF1553 domain-containing protein [bacterium]